ncbi:MAG: hypothetical protein J0L75_02555 [Spirochaetes bacterium]|nr:hypothetical protein [Spirochaetota bacterium]
MVALPGIPRLAASAFFLIATFAFPAPEPLVFEAEAVSTPTNAWLIDRESPRGWNLWSTDADAMKKWSGGKVLRSPFVSNDRVRPEDGAPMLHTVLTNVPKGRYVVGVRHSRALGVSLDGKTWTNLALTGSKVGTFDIDGRFEFWVDDRYATPGSLGTSYYDAVTLTVAPPPPAPPPPRAPQPPVSGWAKTRVAEKMGRGLVALVRPDRKVYLSWRLLTEDGDGVAFNVYRSAAGKTQKLNAEPIRKTTDFIDAQPKSEAETSYTVRALNAGKEGEASPAAIVAPRAEAKGYFSFPIQGGSLQKVGVGDLDGDGVWDYVIKTPHPNVVDPWGPFWKKSPGTYTIEAYASTGKFLWKRDLGWSIEMGIWYSPYLVWDLDGDGKAEVAVKVGEGDPRDEEGKVKSGPEWCFILDGLTGKEKARIPWPDRSGFPEGNYLGFPLNYNFFSRNQLGIAYLDGKTPHLIIARGTYNTMKAEAWQFPGGKPLCSWKWQDADEGAQQAKYRAQGAHTMNCADIDGDGLDEVVLGSIALDDNGVGLWSTGLGHCDCAYLGKIDPSRPGLQIYYNYEPPQKSNGLCLVDARNGKIIWGYDGPTTHVHAQAMCADIDPLHPGLECYGGERDAMKRWLHSSTGERIGDEKSFEIGLYRPTVFWDGDLQREIKMGGSIRKFGGLAVNEEALPSGDDFYVAIADVLGDWREEILTYYKGEMRIYVSTIPAQDRRPTLMQDPIYRRGVCHNSMGYPQSPMSSTVFDRREAALGITLEKTVFKEGEPVRGKVRYAQFDGKPVDTGLTLSVNEWADVEPKSLTLRAAGGAIAEAAFTLVQKKSPPFLGGSKQAVVTAQTASGVRGEGAVDVPETIPLERLILVEAEAFAKQEGGEVKIRSAQEKPGIHGKCFSHWDKQGHLLEWKVKIPEAGRYLLLIRYSAASEAVRETSVDGRAVSQLFDGTGGFGAAASDWKFAMAKETSPVAFELAAGEHTLRMVNEDGNGMNLDYLAFLKTDGAKAP